MPLRLALVEHSGKFCVLVGAFSVVVKVDLIDLDLFYVRYKKMKKIATESLQTCCLRSSVDLP